MADPFTFSAEDERAHRAQRKAARAPAGDDPWKKMDELTQAQAEHASDMQAFNNISAPFQAGVDTSKMRPSDRIKTFRQPAPTQDWPVESGSMDFTNMADDAGANQIGRTEFDSRFRGRPVQTITGPGAFGFEQRRALKGGLTGASRFDQAEATAEEGKDFSRSLWRGLRDKRNQSLDAGNAAVAATPRLPEPWVSGDQEKVQRATGWATPPIPPT